MTSKNVIYIDLYIYLGVPTHPSTPNPHLPLMRLHPNDLLLLQQVLTKDKMWSEKFDFSWRIDISYHR